ncbi:MAG: radical SAM protein [Bacteroidota bacterium]
MVHEKIVKSVLNKHKQRDSWFLDDYSVNPYEGCSCNCQYCYIRGSKYGENMSESLTVKINGPEVLEKQLKARAKKNQYGIISIGSGTDAYIHQEEKFRITEAYLQLMLKYKFPAFISTKRTLIRRDIELLKEIDKAAILPGDLKTTLKRGVILSVSISTMDEKISNTLEPGAVTPMERLQLVKELNDLGFLVGVNAIPTLPFISDTEEELEKIISAAKEHNAHYILVGGLTLFGNEIADSKTLYYKFLERNYPQLISKYNNLYGDKFYTPRYYQEKLKQKADSICARYQIRNRILQYDF